MFYDDVLEQKVREQLREQGLDDDSVEESLDAMRTAGMFDIRED